MTFALMSAGSADQEVMELDSSGNLQIDSNLTVTGNQIKSSTGSTAIHLDNNSIRVAGDVTVDGNNIKSNGGTTAITLSGANVTVAGDLTVTGTNITTGVTDSAISVDLTTSVTNLPISALTLKTTSTGTPAVGIGTAINFVGQTAVSNFENAGFIAVAATDITPTSEDFRMRFGLMAAGSTYTTVMDLDSLGNLQIDGTFQVDGDQIKNSSGTTIITFDVSSETELAGDLQIKGNKIRNDSGNDTITMATGATGLVTLSGDLQVNGDDLTTTQTTFNLLNTTATTVNAFGAATTVSIGNAAGTVTIPGNLTINGTTTNINTTNLLVEDKNITIGDVATPTDVTASGGGITLLGATNKTITWNNATDGWEFNQPIKVTGDIVTSGDLAVNGGDITTNQTTFNLLNTTATTLNIGGAATTTAIGSTASGTTTIGYDLFVNNNVNADSYIVDSLSTYNTQTTTTTSTTPTAISSTTRASQKAVIRIIDNVSGEIHVLEALAFYKSTTAYVTTYAEMYTGAALATFTADVSGGSLRILATPASANSTTFTVARISLD
jgi:hypothetical protein